MIFFIVALGLLAAGAGAALIGNRCDRFARAAGLAGAWGGTAAALAGVIRQIIAGFPAAPAIGPVAGDITVPGMDGCFFLIPILLLGAAAALHAIGYLTHGGHGRIGIFFFGFNTMLASMLLVTMAQSPVWFLLAWELMGITSFALVAYEYHETPVLKASWIYLLAGHAGAGLLILMFLARSQELSPMVIFLLAAAGFGLKAGFPLLHVWLPEAHPAAPAPVSAVMSGGMINLGFYGLLHFGLPATEISGFYGTFLLLAGMAGALIGVLPALAQDNLKRLLAFSSVENIGLITMGFGFGLLGLTHRSPVISVCGFCGALLHIWNHAALKGTLFLAAGEILRATGTLKIDRLGGLFKRLPLTGTLFTGAGAALGGLPPFNAFISEFLLYRAALTGVQTMDGTAFALSLAALPVLAVTGALACGVYAKAIGGVFLGEPRSDAASAATPTPRSVAAAMLGLAAAGMLLLLTAPWLCSRVLLPVLPLTETGLAPQLEGTLGRVVIFSLAAMFLILLLCRLSHRKPRTTGITWDCGYAAPTARMEYTGFAITQPLCDYWRHLTGCRRRLERPQGLFPQTASASVTGDDPGVTRLWQPLFRAIARTAEKIHVLQSGLLHFYILLMILSVAAMLCWGWFRSCPAPVSGATAETTVEVCK